MLSVNISDIAIITVKKVDYRCIILKTLANLKQLIYQNILFLKIVDRNKKYCHIVVNLSLFKTVFSTFFV